MSGWATLADVEIGVGIDIMYNHQFVQNEEVVNVERGTQAVYSLSAGAILPGTLAGSVYLDGQHLGIFRHEDADVDECVVNDPTLNILSVRVNCKTGKVIIVWRNRIKKGESKVVVSYEYYTKE